MQAFTEDEVQKPVLIKEEFDEVKVIKVVNFSSIIRLLLDRQNMLMRFFYQAADVFTVLKSVHSEEEGVEVKVIMI